MYAYYKGDIDKLTQNEMWAIQYLYGRPERLKYQLIPITTNKQVITEQPNSTQTHGDPLDLNLPDLCSINHPDNLLITSNHHLNIFHKKWVWIMNIQSDQKESKSEQALQNKRSKHGRKQFMVSNATS
jgi:hypothetical protein